jgi:hypothetical protein
VLAFQVPKVKLPTPVILVWLAVVSVPPSAQALTVLADKLPVTVKLPNVPNTVEFTCVVIVVFLL